MRSLVLLLTNGKLPSLYKSLGLRFSKIPGFDLFSQRAIVVKVVEAGHFLQVLKIFFE